MSVRKLAFAVLALPLFAAAAMAQVALTPHNANGITYVSGGIGEQELVAIAAMKRDYNLRLLFAVTKSGEFLADVRVKLVDKAGKTLLDAMSDGPYFFAKVKPGNYKVVAESGGKSITKSVDISPNAATSLSFYWAAG